MPVAAPTQPPDDLWSELHARLRGFVGRRVADPDAAENLAQEVLLRLHRSLGDLRAQDRLAGVPEDAHETEGREHLARCLGPLVARLPEPYREALSLTDLGELSQVEAARRVGLSVPGMKARVQRARAQVRELLTDCCHVTLDPGRRIADVERQGPLHVHAGLTRC